MTRHLAVCAAKHDASGAPTSLALMRIEGADNPSYWLYLEARLNAHVQRLDALLRRVWLECCGHLSAFRLGQREVPMRTKIGQALVGKGLTFHYDFDFGSTTTLCGRVLDIRHGSLGRVPLRLLARNNPLPLYCDACPEPATVICPFCIGSGPCLFCDEHVPQHPCADEGAYLPVINSPRMGVCAYGT